MKKLWIPSKKIKIQSNLFRFEKFISKRYKVKFNFDYQKILSWTIKNSPEFWDAVWDFCNIKGTKGKKKLTNLKFSIRILFFQIIS